MASIGSCTGPSKSATSTSLPSPTNIPCLRVPPLSLGRQIAITGGMAPARILLLSRRRSIERLPFPFRGGVLSSTPSSPSPAISKTLAPGSATGSFGLSQLLRYLSSSSTIKPISYPVKPKDASPAKEDAAQPRPSESLSAPPEGRQEAVVADEADTQRRAEMTFRTWTREDARFVKDGPVISPVFYPPKVAPLPEDKAARPVEGESEVGEGEQVKANDEQLLRERRRIEANARVRRALLMQQEEENVPFPTLIKQEKKKPKVDLDLAEAIREIKANAQRRFGETVEAHAILGVDPRRGDQMVRGAVTLPHGTGKVVRVAVFAEGTAADEARAAGADIVGGDELVEEIMNGTKNNVALIEKNHAPIIFFLFGYFCNNIVYHVITYQIARILGPRGLMPNPKLGSVTSDVAGAVKEAKCGRIDFKIDKTAIVHVGLGKVNDITRWRKKLNFHSIPYATLYIICHN
ncbi:hypothetical protein Taro_030593 [Colocasia esculenta]|uniref:50S ribosomal protein L1 n=1 Tax=Colocasia esculenta TaxID=4460 RepID=A0A843W3T3_COLES|nr:hypothetical protein [Colocasia esculenta]